MATRGEDPYKTLGVTPAASDDELRTAYRRLVQLHHPDHNAGSPESARRFEAVQEAYAQAVKLRAAGASHGSVRAAGGFAGGASTRAAGSGDVESRIAEMEQELRAARERARRAQEAARQAAREAAREASAQATDRPSSGARRKGDEAGRPSDEELGYVTTDDSISKILSDAFADARSQLSGLYAEARDEPRGEQLADLLDEIASKLKREPKSGEQ